MTSDAVQQLATAVSLAARIEPELLRAARLRLFPGMDVSAEGDLWFSELVASRSARRIVLDPEVVASLRRSLQNDRTLLDNARAVVKEIHRLAPPAIQLEEEIVYLALSGADVEAAINTKLTSVLNAIASEGRRGLIDWAARALPRMPAIVQNTTAAAALRLVAGGQSSDALHVSRDPAIAALVDRAVPKTRVFARLVPEHDGLSVEIGRTELPASHEIELPKTEPLILELATLGHTEVVEVPREGTLLRETDGAVSIRTIARDVFRLEEAHEEERTTVRILVMTGLTGAALPHEPDLDLVLIAGDVAERGTAEEYAHVSRLLRERWPELPILATPGAGDAAGEFDFLRMVGFTADGVDFAKTLHLGALRIGVVSIDTSLGDFEAAQIFNVCGGDPLAWARAHHAAILLTYNAAEHLGHDAQERWEAFGTGEVFDFIATGSANTPELSEGYVVVELPDPDGGALVSIHRHGEREIRRQAIHPRMDAMPPAEPRRVLVAGSAGGLPVGLQELCRAIGSLLALQGHELLTGGWPGVDFLVAEGFDHAAPHRAESIAHYFGGERKVPDYKRGRPVFFEREDAAIKESVRNADVVILIEGASGTRSVGVVAIAQGIPVIPIGGGAAAELRNVAFRPGRWPGEAAGLLQRLNRMPVWHPQGLEGLLSEQASIASTAHDVNELIRVARPLDATSRPSVFISAGDDSLFAEQFRHHAEQLIVRSDISNDISALPHARFAVVFMGPSYLEDAHKHDELQRILERAKSGDLRMYWFLETQCDYAPTGIGSFMAAHDVTRPLDTLSDEEILFIDHRVAGEFAAWLRTSPQSSAESAPPPKSRRRVLLSYSDTDQELIDEFRSAAEDVSFATGAEYAEGDVAIVFIDPPYLSFFGDVLERLIDAARRDELTLYWFLVSKCDYAATGIGEFQAAHDISKPLRELPAPLRREVFRRFATRPFTAEGEHDIVLFHSSFDQESAIEIYEMLMERGIRPWFHDWHPAHLLSGRGSPVADIPEMVRAALVVYGPSSTPAQVAANFAMIRKAMARHGNRIPIGLVIMRGANPPDLAISPENLTRIDFNQPESDPLAQLEAFITSAM